MYCIRSSSSNPAMAARKRKEEVGVGFKFPPAGWREDDAILWIKSSTGTVQDRASKNLRSSTAVDRDDVRIKRVGLIISSGHNATTTTDQLSLVSYSNHPAPPLHRSTAPPHTFINSTSWLHLTMIPFPNRLDPLSLRRLKIHRLA